MRSPDTSCHAEIALEPDLAIIDAHQHLWPALPPGVTVGRPYTIEEFNHDASSGHNIVASVYVECLNSYRTEGPQHLRPVGETEWVLTQKPRTGLMSGIVGYADMLLGARAADVLDAHQDLAGSRLKGIRHSVVWDPHPDVFVPPTRPAPHILLDPRFLEGTAEIAKRGLVYECGAYFHQLPELAALARKQPELRIVLCHLGGPAASGYYATRRNEMLEVWRRNIKDVAQCPNVVLKLGAIGMTGFGAVAVLGSRASSEAIAAFWGPEVRYAIDAFGPERCMCESNFPVDDALCDYVTLWNAFKRMTSELSRPEREWLFEKTARSVYRL